MRIVRNSWIWVLGAVLISSAPTLRAADDDLKLILDTAIFRTSTANPAEQAGHSLRLELYLSVDRTGLHYAPAGDRLAAKYSVDAKLLAGDEEIEVFTVTGADTVQSRATIKPGQQFMYTTPVFLKPGTYTIVATLRDEVRGDFVTRETHIAPAEIDDAAVSLSDIQLATQIRKAKQKEGMFVKNQLHILPNPAASYGDGLEKLSFYAEVYNLDRNAGERATYRADYVIEDESGTELHRIKGKKRNRRHNTSAIYASFDIESLNNGDYFLKLDLQGEGVTAVESRKAFRVHRAREALAEALAAERQVYAGMSDGALDNYYKQISYIVSEEEKNVFPQLETQAKREFLVQFWRRRDTTPNTPENEFKSEYIRRLAQAKRNFSRRESDGWASDRGRVLLTYGAPDFIDREPASPDKHALEIWQFKTLESGHSFYFIDFKGDNEYELVHSTFRREKKNPDWQVLLYR